MTTSTGVARASACSSAHWPGTRSSNPATVTGGNAVDRPGGVGRRPERVARQRARRPTPPRGSPRARAPIGVAAAAATRAGGDAAPRAARRARARSPTRKPGRARPTRPKAAQVGPVEHLAQGQAHLDRGRAARARRRRRPPRRGPRRPANVTASRPITAAPPRASSRSARAAASRRGTTSSPPRSRQRSSACGSADEKAGARVRVAPPSSMLSCCTPPSLGPRTAAYASCGGDPGLPGGLLGRREHRLRGPPRGRRPHLIFRPHRDRLEARLSAWVATGPDPGGQT